MSKTIAFVFIGMLALSMLVVGCGSSEAPGASETTQTSPEAASAADAAIDSGVISETDDVQIGELIA